MPVSLVSLVSLQCAAWNPNCLLLAHLAVSWVTKNIIPGQRRALLSTQVRMQHAGMGEPCLWQQSSCGMRQCAAYSIVD
jgi:hypothetical protein